MYKMILEVPVLLGAQHGAVVVGDMYGVVLAKGGAELIEPDVLVSDA